MVRTPGPRPAARPARGAAPDSTVDTMKVAGVLLCLSAAVSVVVSLVGTDAAAAGSDRAASLGGAFMVLLFGAALFQGVGAVRSFMLVVCGLGALAAIGTAAVLHSMREVQIALGGVLLTAVGYLVLLLAKEASRARAAAGVLLIVSGAAVGLGAQSWMSVLAKRDFAREVEPGLSSEREYRDPASGLSIQVPAGWSLLRNDAGIFQEVQAKVKLADPDAGTVAFLDDEPRPLGFVSLDHHLDGVLEKQKESGLDPKQEDRRDVRVGKAPARRMSMRWTYEARPYAGFVSVWQDGPQVFTLFGAAVGPWNRATEERFQALEGALRFSAPVETALSDAQGRLTRECPLFTADAVRMIGRRIPPASPTEAYFRTAWSWAIRGQTQLDAASAAELRDLMGTVFSRMPPAERSRFAVYTERLRGGAPTTAAEDASALGILGRAAIALPEDALARLRSRVEQAVTVGGLF